MQHPAERRVRAVADPMFPAEADLMSPAAAALMRPAGVVPVLASHPAAGPPDPEAVSDLQGAAWGHRGVAQADPVASAVGRVGAASVEAGATDGDHRTVLPRLHGWRSASFFTV
jgi:hypothetical protein